MKTNSILPILLLFIFAGIQQDLIGQVVTMSDSIDHFIDERIKHTTLYKKDRIEISEEDVLKTVDAMPAFGVYKDTYFTTGVPLNRPVNNSTADVLFQISIRQRLTRSRLPFNTFLYLTYTQKSFWNIYAESAPFRDTNYNPSIGIGKYIIHNNVLKGSVFMQIEHESNGRDGKDSRSWNRISLSSKYLFNMQLTLDAKIWIPIVDGKENEDLTDYRGIGTLAANYMTKNRKWWITAELNPRKGFGNINTTLTAAFKVSKNANQYLYARFYNGKGEGLLDYKRYEMNIRVGFCIKPDFGGIF